VITLNPGTAPASVSSGGLQVARPAGLHNFQAKYSGDRHYLPATSMTVPVVFQ
jgi:hypothetical protein